jgi:hypothetical protein
LRALAAPCHSAASERELYDEMTKLYPDWASNQTWLMFGLGQSQPWG